MPITISGSGTITGASTLATPVVNPTFTTQTAATIKSAAVNTPTVFQDSAGTEVGTLCRAWVNFNGTGTISTNQTIRANFNVSSVFKNGTGDYTVNFTNALSDANYCLQATANRSDALEPTVFGNQSTTQTTSTCRVLNTNNAGLPVDGLFCHIAVFR